MRAYLRLIVMVYALIATIIILPGLSDRTIRRTYLKQIVATRAAYIQPKALLIGDSLTDNGALWGSRLGVDPFSVTTIARAGYASPQVMYIFDTSHIAGKPPIFLCVGTNDAFFKVGDINEFGRNYALLVDKILKSDSRLVITLIPPTSLVALNPVIMTYNNVIREIARRHDIPVIDLWPELEANGVIRPEDTIDGIHFTEQGYAIWSAHIKAYL